MRLCYNLVGVSTRLKEFCTDHGGFCAVCGVLQLDSGQ
jgi:hypothetical protein